jgi:hypothetical protein
MLMKGEDEDIEVDICMKLCQLPVILRQEISPGAGEKPHWNGLKKGRIKEAETI